MRFDWIVHICRKLSLGRVWLIKERLPLVEVVVLSDLIDSKSVWAFICVLEAPRLLYDRSWSRLHYFFFLFLYVRLVVLSDCEQILSPQAILAVDGRIWVVKCASLPAPIIML